MSHHPAPAHDHMVFHVGSLQLEAGLSPGPSPSSHLKAASLELLASVVGKDIKRTIWWLPQGDLDLLEQGISLHKAVLTLGAVVFIKASLLCSHRALIAALSLCGSEFHQTGFLSLFLIWLFCWGFFLLHD